MKPFSLSPKTVSFISLTTIVLMGLTGLSIFAYHDFDTSQLFQDLQKTSRSTFILLMAILPLFGFPIAPFYLFAGATYEWGQAVILCSISLALNMTLAYPIGRYLLRNAISGFIAKIDNKEPRLKSYNDFRITFIIRTFPGIPYVIQNYVLSVLKINFWRYLIISLCIQVTFAGGMAALANLAINSKWIIGSIIVIITAIFFILRKKYSPPKKTY